MTITEPPISAAPAAEAVPQPRPRRIPQWWRDTSGFAFWAIQIFVVGLWVRDQGLQELTKSIPAALTSLGQLSGLLASALLLIQVFLMSRVPWFERAWGQDELVRLHRYVGFTSFNLMIAHVFLIWFGYAGSPGAVWSTLVSLVLDYPGMLLAVAGTLCLCLVVATSIKKARAKLRYESWHLIHLYGYLGAGLALPHQLWTGTSFLHSTVDTVFWWTIYAVCAATVIVYRVGLPLFLTLRHPIRVVDVRPEGPDATTVTVAGPGIADYEARAGQFFTWRFQDGPGWTRGNPYSLSAAPQGNTLRLTAAHLGDGSARLAHLKPGTRVLLEGPYGRLHAGVRTKPKVLLFGAGIGIAPLRALLEDLPADAGDITVVHRVRDLEHRHLGAELDELTQARRANYIAVPGPRVRSRESWLPADAEAWGDADAIRHLVPDVAERDVYLCGASGWMDIARKALLDAGVPAKQIHHERFSW